MPQVRPEILEGRGGAHACTRYRACGALPVARLFYLYPNGNSATYGLCAVHRGHWRRRLAGERGRWRRPRPTPA